ncbi:MAG: hypothetical protein ABFD52_00635 [Acidobacteriota bacterium]
MKLTEFLDTESQLNESSDGALRMEVPFLEADKQTANHRLYPLSVLSAAVEGLKKRLSKATGYGSTSHKDRLEVPDVSHIIEDVKMKGKTAVATLKILPTEKGHDLQVILKNGGRIGVSARGRGEVRVAEGQEIVNQGYSMEGLDFVLSPASGMYAGMEMVCESAPIEDRKETAMKLTEEELDRKYAEALFAGTKLSREDIREMNEDHESMELLTKARDEYGKALAAGCKLTFEEYLDFLEKEAAK